MITQINNVAEVWWNWMWPMFWQVSVLVVFLGAIDLILRKHVWPQVRYALWLLVLIKLILPPTFSLPSSIISQARIKTERMATQLLVTNNRAEISPAELSSEKNVYPTNAGARPFVEPEAVRTNVTSDSHVETNSSAVTAPEVNVKIHWHSYAMIVWLVVMVALSLWVVVRFRKLRKFHAGKFSSADLPQWFGPLLTQTAEKLGLRKIPEIALSRNISSPAVFGVFRPVLVLPAESVRSLSQKRIEHILLHELAHIKRGDLLVNTFYMLLQIVYWFNPLLWLIRRRLQHIRELCCDATVARILREKTDDYRETILEVTQRYLAKPVEPGIGLLGMTETSSRLLVRLKWLEKKTWKHHALHIGTACAVVTLMTACVLPMAKAKNKEKPPVQGHETTQADPNSEPNGAMINTVRGIVTDKLGRPRNNVYIATSFNTIRKEIRTNENGQFTLEGIQPKQRHWMAYSQASRAVGLFTIPQDYDGQFINVILRYGKAVAEGRVVGPDGRDLANRRVELITRTNRGATYYSESYRKTDEYGNYSTNIPCGPNLTVQVRPADANKAEQKYITKPIPLSDNQIFYLMPKLVIGDGKPEETDDGKALYSSHVLNEEGQPIVGVRTTLGFRTPEHPIMRVESVMTHADGRWQRRLPKDLSHLEIGLLHPEYIQQSWQRVSSAELLNGTNVMIMKHGLPLKGVVRNQEGELVENALVDTGGGDGTSPFGEVLENCTTPRTLADGSFSVGGLAAENLDIIVSALGYAPQVVSVDITDGMKPIEVSLKKGRTYTGQVVDVSGKPIEGVKIDVGEWRLGNKLESITRITQTDSKGYFKIKNLPDEGSIRLDFGKRDSGLLGFQKEIPEDLSVADRVVMYQTPVFVGKVVDAETGEPITNFTLVIGINSPSFGNSVDWNRYSRQDVTSEDGSFSKTWTGYGITYPFEGDCCLKVEAKGYLAQIAPPIRLGEQYEPRVIRMTKADPWKGVVIDPKSAPAVKAQVGWVGPGQSAFIKNGKFDMTGFANQAEVVVDTDSKGQFDLPPSRDEGLIVALHESGYASVASGDYKNASQIRLIPWARIEGTIVSAEKAGREFVLSINPVILPEEPEHKLIRWMFDRTSFSGENFTVNFVPSIPLNIGQIIESKQYDAVYIDPQPGETYKVKIEGKDQFVAERKWPSLVGKALPDLKGIEIDFNPGQYKDKMILVCFWDMNQRPSRNCMSQLAERFEQLREKDVVLVAIQASKANKNTLDQWTREHNISFPSGMVGVDEKETLFTWGIKSLPWLILTDRMHVVRAEGFGLSELDSKYEDLYMNKLKASTETKRPGVSRTQNDRANPVVLSNIALLYHREPDVRIKALKTLAASENPQIIHDLIRAHSVEIYTPVHNEYDRVLQSLTGNRNIRGKSAWKAWLASEVEAGRLRIEYLPIKPASDVQSEILAFALMGPDDFDEMAAALTAATYDRQKCQDAIRYMVFNDHLARVREFLAGDWLDRLFAHQKININDVGYFLNGLANPGPLRKQINTHVRDCLDSENPTVVANALNLIAGVKGFSTRFTVPGVESKVEALLSSSVPEVAMQVKRALARVKPHKMIVPKSTITEVKDGLHIMAFIDGRDTIKIKDAELWYEHHAWNLPGKWWDRANNIKYDEPTYINGIAWKPEWEGNISKPYRLEHAVPMWEANNRIKLTKVEARGSVSITELPRQENDYMLSILLDDDSFDEAEWYEFIVQWGASDSQEQGQSLASGSFRTGKQVSVSSAKNVLQRMIDSAQQNEIVIVPNGVYAEPVTISKSLTLKGESLKNCVIEVTADKPAVFIDTKGKGKVVIEAVTVKWQLATSDRCEYPFAVAVKDSNIEIKNCCFQPLGNFKHSPVAIYSRGFSEMNINMCRLEGFEYTVCFGEGTKGTIRNSLVMDSGHQGIILYAGAMVEITGNVVTGSRFHAVRSTGGTLNMTNNLIINNANRGVYLGNKSANGSITNNIIIGSGTGVGGFARSKVKIENNVIADSSYAGIGMRDSCSLSIRDNILRGNERGLILFKQSGGNGNKVLKNTFWQNKVDTENMNKPADSMVADPGFVDAENGDFSLKQGPAMQQKQGLTKPEMFKKLWKIWMNRKDKNMPFTEN